MPDPELPSQHGPEWRFSALEGGLAVLRDWVRSLEKAINAVIDSNPITEQSPAWVEMALRMKNVEGQLELVARSAKRTATALTGDWDESGTTWSPGVREQVQKVAAQVTGVAADVAEANAKADKFLSRVNWALGGLWLIVAGVLVELANSYFGWFGAAHAALKDTVH